MARSREFDPEVALDKAMHQFWSKGYFDTSIRDLIECTGVNFYGLYNTFENKHGLFLAALDHYQENVTRQIVDELQQPGPLREAIQRTLGRVHALMKTAHGRVGCLMCNTALEVAPHDSAAKDKVMAHMALLYSEFRERLVRAQAAEEVSSDLDIEAFSEYLTNAVYTIGLLVRSGQDDDYVDRHIRSVISTLA